MNWTGGRLSRHSRGVAAASLNQRQKAYFARVHNSMRNGTKSQSPIKGSIFGKIRVQQAERGRESSVEPRRTYREESQQPHHNTSRHAGSSNHLVYDRHPSRPVEPQYIRQPTRGPKQERVSDNCLYSATPPPREKRKREIYVSESEDEEVDLVAKKRKSLLEKGDWVGISYQRPIQLAFASTEHTENVGRRRKTTDGNRARYASRQPILRSPFMTRARPRSPRNYNAPGQRGKLDVRIHIGDRVVPPGISSSTAASRSRGYSTHKQLRNTPQVASSDVMLLDNEDVLSSAISRIINETPFEYQQVEAFGSGLCDGNRNPDQLEEEEEGEDGHETGRDKDPPSGWDSQNVLNKNDHPPERHPPSSDEAQDIPNKRNRAPSVSPILGTTFASISPGSIKQPIPRSSKVSSILRSSSTEIAYSTVAQVGKIKAVVPSSQVLDNEIWETWMASLYNEEQLYEEDGTVGAARSISPGISTAPARRVSRRAPPRYQRAATEFEVEEFGEVGTASRIVSRSIRDSSINEDHQQERQHRRNVPDSTDRSCMRRVEERSRDVEELRHRPFIIPSPVPEFEVDDENRGSYLGNLHSGLREENTRTQAQSTTNPTKEQDPDDIWRTFIFGSDEADHISTPVLSPGLDLHNPIASSMLGNPSTAVSAKSPPYIASQYRNISSHSDSTPKSHTPSTSSMVDSSYIEIPWNPPTGVPSTRMRSTLDGTTSLHASDGSRHSSHSDPALSSDNPTSSKSVCATTASLAVMTSSQSGASKSSESLPSQRHQKLVFTKPKRYQGVKSASESSQVEEEHLHIGYGMMRDNYVEARQKKECDIYSLVDSDEIDSIEDN